MTATIHTAYFYRGDIIPCTVETEIKPGIGIHVVGLPDAVVRETLLRVVTAIQATGYRIPGKKVIICIEPNGGPSQWDGAFRPREPHAAFDLAIALSILIASEQVPHLKAVDKVLFFAELGLDGSLRAPYTGIGGAPAALVLSWQLRRTWEEIIGFPTDEDKKTIYTSKDNLAQIIEAIKTGQL